MTALGLSCMVMVVVALTAGSGEARHHHMRHQPLPTDEWDKQGDSSAADREAPAHESEHIDSMKHPRFARVHSKYFHFAPVAPAPCLRDGFKRDRFGICREVW